MTARTKTVYVLGAGFSIDAGAPSQAKIIENIYKLRDRLETKKNAKAKPWLKMMDTFLTEQLLVSDNQKSSYALEDIYTPIDKSLTEMVSFRDYTPKDLLELRDALNRLVVLAIREAINERSKDKKTIEAFAKYVVDNCSVRLKDEKKDNVAIITTNWDIMLDNAIYTILSAEAKIKGLPFVGVLDYCCYISSLYEKADDIKPGLYALGKGGYNVKLLKLHGSLNWLQCPKCQRLYVSLHKKFAGGYVYSKNYCRHCERNFKQKEHPSNQLHLNLITPTFLKNLNNIQNKLIWQNAGIELSEAAKVVFIGYSLPQADFEFKQLLSRMIPSDAKIEVVLSKNDNPANIEEKYQYLAPGYRYQNFFSNRELNIFYDGVKDYVQKYCG
jgi:NAD-dependent SIR2 family protein deacetylase